MPTGLEEIRALRREDKREHRRLWLVLWALVAAALVFDVCFRGWGYGFVSPLEAAKSLIALVRVEFATVTQGYVYTSSSELTAGLKYYAETVMRFRTALLLMAGGAVLALSGTVYQASMRNPMAVPTMLGVSSGVNLAQLLLVLIYGTSVYSLTTTRYLYNYGIAAAILLIVLLGGKLAGGKHASVADMLIVGTVINRMINTVVNYVRTEMDTETLVLFQEYSENSYNIYNQFSNLAIMCAVSLALLLPVYLMRFSYNAISFEDGDASAMGVRPGAMRVYGLVAGALLTTTAMIHCGNVGMLALMVPHLCRYLFGADFRKLFWSSAVCGALLMLLSEIIQRMIVFEEYAVPIGSIISLLTVPVLIWAMLRQRRGWE